MLKELLANIKNARHFQQVYLGKTLIEITNLEKLHSSLPKLDELETAYLYNNKDGKGEERTISQVKDIAESVRVLYFDFYVVNDDDGTLDMQKIFPSFERCIKSWFSYVGKKYKNVEQFKVNCPDFKALCVSNGEFERALIGTLLQLKHTKTYGAGACPYFTGGIKNVFVKGSLSLYAKS
jgi:hypothetical protein